MIDQAREEQLEEIRRLWKRCFPKLDPRYLDFYFKTYFDYEKCFVNVVQGKVVSAMIRNPHELMFNDRVLQASMIVGVATLPEYRKQGHMRKLMEVVLDACAHTELLTLVQTEQPEIYERYGFEMIYHRQDFTLERKDVRTITNYGCAYEPAAIDLLKVYSAFIHRFNGFYTRDLEYFVHYKNEVTAVGGKIVAYYNEKKQIRGYAVMRPQGSELRVEEIVYLDALSLMKLVNAALQERKTVHLLVSEAEDLLKVFPGAKVQKYGAVMARLNDAALFSKLYNIKVTNVKEAFAISRRPLNLNESM